MGGNEVESTDFYQVLGLRKGCSDAEIKNAYRKLALRWHPDRCSAFGNSKNVEEAKKKFQTIQEAYSVLSNANKRFLYDIGVYDCHDDDEDGENGMADFLNEMAVMMSENKAAENGEETSTFEELKDLFEEMFESDDIDSSSLSSSNSQTASAGSTTTAAASSSSSSSSSYNSSSNYNLFSSNKRASSEMSADHHFQGFCIGTGGGLSPGSRGSRNARKQGSSRKGYR